MLQRLLVGMTIFAALGACMCETRAQEGGCKVLDAASARRYLPDRVPMETEVIQVDMNHVAAIEFPDKARVAAAQLSNSGLSAQMRQKYQYVLVAEAKVRLDHLNLPAGMVGLGFAAENAKDAPARTMIARDFTGSEIGQVSLSLATNARDESSISFVPKGANEFELNLGGYVVQGAER
jgi:hypothetical protein